MSFDPHALKLYVDGSCLKNPGGRSGFAVWIEHPATRNEPDESLGELGFHESTNNRMELRACIWAHRWVLENAAPELSRVQVITDSKYVSENWRRAASWRANGWRNASGRPVENADLWKEWLSLRSKLRVRTDIEWTTGKKTPILKAVDKAAKAAAGRPTKVDRGYRKGKIGRTKDKLGGVAALLPAWGQEATIRIYQSGVVHRGSGENKIKFELFSTERGRFLEKFVAYAAPGIAAELHRQHAYRVRFNASAKYPVIEAVLEEIPQV